MAKSSKIRSSWRDPIFVFAFEAELFTFKLNTPAFDPLFQLPPSFAMRDAYQFELSKQKGEPDRKGGRATPIPKFLHEGYDYASC